jgi:hypothetical protein
MSEHAGNCGYVQNGVPCDCGLWEQSATLFKHQERIRELEAYIEKYSTPCKTCIENGGWDHCICPAKEMRREILAGSPSRPDNLSSGPALSDGTEPSCQSPNNK